MSGVVILDRDGILNELVERPAVGYKESPLALESVRLCAGVIRQLLRLRTAGYLLACVTNQPAAAKGEISLSELDAVHQRVLDLLLEGGVALDAQRMCRHHPDFSGPLGGPCKCRKPAPGMIYEVVSELAADLSQSWMIGDTDADVVAGRSAGIYTILVMAGGSEHKRGRSCPDGTAPDLGAAVDIILGETERA